jgi:tetratricopeptide (TPR) repeat protein
MHRSIRLKSSRATRLSLAACLVFSGCDSPAPAPAEDADAAALVSDLRKSRLDLALARLDAGNRDEALSMLARLVDEHPDFTGARDAMAAIIGVNAWSVPVMRIRHQLPVDQLALNANSLWVGLAGDTHTVLRWNLADATTEAVMFPRPDESTLSLLLSPDGNRIVVGRGESTLLCDAHTLKPVADLGPVPDGLARESVIVFSGDGILLAHPSLTDSDAVLFWRIRDSATGQVIRDSTPSPASAPRALGAHIDRHRLRVLDATGGLAEIPVSPVEPESLTPFPEKAALRHAQFSADGTSALASIDSGPLAAPELAAFAVDGAEGGDDITAAGLLRRFPWHAKPGIWSGLMRDDPTPPVTVAGNTARFSIPGIPSITADSEIIAIAWHDDVLAVGEASGLVTLHRILPRLDGGFDAASIADFLTGKQSDGTEIDAPSRVEGLLAHLPEAVQYREPAPESLLPLWRRLAHADASGASWPDLLETTAGLQHTRWHQDLAAAVVRRTAGNPVTTIDSEWDLQDAVSQAFATGDDAEVLRIISTSHGTGPAAARALELALASERPEWIDACLAKARDLPPLVAKIARSRTAWLHGQKAAAFAIWRDDPPDMTEVRKREDWHGWEQADFSPALDSLRADFEMELAALVIPEDASAGERAAVIARLTSPDTLAVVGRTRFAEACLKAALATAAIKEETDNTFRLASLARTHGAPAAPCLRAEAMSLTALGDFKNARARWIDLITMQPVETHEPGDYAEAAYTSFENADPRQAMEILNTGIARFPEDANFALRAGWVALLTNHPERALHFLLQGLRIGFPPEKLENATALLTIAAVQLGDADQARQHFDALTDIDPAWADPATLETLDWPEDLKSALRQMAW